MTQVTRFGRPRPLVGKALGYDPADVIAEEDPEPPPDLVPDGTVEVPVEIDGPLVILRTQGIQSALDIALVGPFTPTSVILVALHVRGGNGTPANITAGWSLIEEVISGSGDSVHIIGKVSDGTETTLHVEPQSSTTPTYGYQVFEVTGVTLPETDSSTGSGGSGSTTLTTGSMTITTTGVMVGSYMLWTDASTFTQSGDWTFLGTVGPVFSHPTGGAVFQTFDAGTTDDPTVSVVAGVLNGYDSIGLAFEATGTTEVWVLADEASDGNDATYAEVPVAPTGYVVRFALDQSYVIARVVLLIGYAAAGAQTLDLYGADLADFSDEILLASVDVTATGSYTGDTVEFAASGAESFMFYRIATEDDVRIYTLEAYQGSQNLAEYQLRAEEGQPNGYAGLDGSGLVPYDQLGTGGDGSGDNVLHDDGTWSPGCSVAIGEGVTTVDPATAITFAGTGDATVDVTDDGGGSATLTFDVTGGADAILRSGGGVEDEFTHASCGATEDIALADGNRHVLMLDAASCEITISDATQGASVTLVVVQDAVGGRLINWSSVPIQWAGGVAPTLSTDPDAIDVITAIFYDAAATWLGFYGPVPVTLADTVVPETTFGQSSDAGVAALASRADHTHGTPDEPEGGTGGGTAGFLLLADAGRSSPIVFGDILQADDYSDLLYSEA